MSLWQGTRWTQSGNQSVPAPRTLSVNSSAATSTVSLVSSSSGGGAPRRPLTQLNLRQERRSSSNKTVESTKLDHDPIKTLSGILGELPELSMQNQGNEEKEKIEVGPEKKVDVGGRTLADWLEDLERNKLVKLSKDIEQRMSKCNYVVDRRNNRIKPVPRTPGVYYCLSYQCACSYRDLRQYPQRR